MQLKVNELCMKIDDLERELNLKSGAVDRKLNLRLKNLNVHQKLVKEGIFARKMSRRSNFLDKKR